MGIFSSPSTLQVSVSPTECFLKHLSYPDDEDCAVDLRQSAVVIMSQLDRLASSYLPISASHKVVNLLPLFDIVFSSHFIHSFSPFLSLFFLHISM